MKLLLRHNMSITGEFIPGHLNLMMVFQVNCPGCFMHGFPLMRELQTYFVNNLSCVALSTAFEDFELNTPENSKLLFTKNQLLGETLKAQQSGLLEWDAQTITFPVLMDDVIGQPELLQPEFIDKVIENIREGTPAATPDDLRNMRTTLSSYFGQVPQCGYTFAANLMRGTPSFFLFTDTMEILTQWFGHADSRVIKEKLGMLMRLEGL